MSDAASVKLNSASASRESRQRFAALPTFVVAPEAPLTAKNALDTRMRLNAPKKAKLSEGRLRSNAEGARKGPRALPHAARFNSIVKDRNPEGLGAD